jgi:large subunit ribosomal protein L15
VVGLDDLARLTGSEVTVETLAAVGLVRASAGPVKLLANGEIARAVTVRGIKVSATAREKVVAAGGTVEA